jgi:pimeloyl-ACP methyl ester carboxylesterase
MPDSDVTPAAATPPELDPAETHVRITSPVAGCRLFLRHLPPHGPAAKRGGAGDVVLYIHGGTFPSALSIAHRFAGRSWRDELCERGYHVWGLDFLGFGASDRYPEMAEPAERYPALGGAAIASQQIEHAVRFIIAQHGVERLSLVAHSWGTIAAGPVPSWSTGWCSSGR